MISPLHASPWPCSRLFSRFSFSPALGLLVCLFLLLSSAGCSPDKAGEGKGAPKKKPAVAVTVASATKKNLPVEIVATGHVEASATVEVRSQVTGLLKTVHFKEGDEVKAGDLLFTIDPRSFAANLAKAEAGLAKDKAELENARREADRYALAAQKGYVSVEQSDQAATRVVTFSATVKADQAAVDNARLELEYCTIRAPFAGRTGEIQSDQGNLIKANADGPMVTLNQTQPVLAAFTVPGQHLQDIFRYMAAGALQVTANSTLSDQEPLIGKLAFIDNTVDPTTGVIRLKTSFSDSQNRLWPGQLIDIRLHLTDRIGCIVVPSQAVLAGQNGAYVYVVKEDQTVAYRPVTPGMLFKGETLIEEGLKQGERVVTDGQLQLAEGVRIAERDQTQGKTEGRDKEAEPGVDRARGKQ
jgi:multidrug efflux system membrane fusion protein